MSNGNTRPIGPTNLSPVELMETELERAVGGALKGSTRQTTITVALAVPSANAGDPDQPVVAGKLLNP